MKSVFGSSQYKCIQDLDPTIEESILESRYPHIVKKLLLIWGSEECIKYIEHDLFHHTPTPERPMREGFSLEVLIEIDKLLHKHIEQFPNIKSETGNRYDPRLFQ